jgi:hypothetical protein
MIYVVSTWLLPVIIAITFHEAAHAYVARLLGDETASRLGRVSLNPLKHIDPFGTIVLPGLLLLARSPFLFGYAKPVPVNFRALRNPRRDARLVEQIKAVCAEWPAYGYRRVTAELPPGAVLDPENAAVPVANRRLSPCSPRPRSTVPRFDCRYVVV